jgi:hypothetical protein
MRRQISVNFLTDFREVRDLQDADHVRNRAGAAVIMKPLVAWLLLVSTAACLSGVTCRPLKSAAGSWLSVAAAAEAGKLLVGLQQ